VRPTTGDTPPVTRPSPQLERHQGREGIVRIDRLLLALPAIVTLRAILVRRLALVGLGTALALRLAPTLAGLRAVARLPVVGGLPRRPAPAARGTRRKT
jgi:hypothetical protein